MPRCYLTYYNVVCIIISVYYTDIHKLKSPWENSKYICSVVRMLLLLLKLCVFKI